MKKLKRIRLFKAYLSFKSEGKEKIYILENCVSVKGHLAQLHKGRIRPIFAKRTESEIGFLMAELRKYHGTLHSENYKVFLPYMVKMEVNIERVIAIDLDSHHGVNLMWLKLDKAVHV